MSSHDHRLDRAVRRVIADLGFCLNTPFLRRAALSTLDGYPSQAGAIRAQQFWRDRVLAAWREEVA